MSVWQVLAEYVNLVMNFPHDKFNAKPRSGPMSWPYDDENPDHMYGNPDPADVGPCSTGRPSHFATNHPHNTSDDPDYEEPELDEMMGAPISFVGSQKSNMGGAVPKHAMVPLSMYDDGDDDDDETSKTWQQLIRR